MVKVSFGRLCHVPPCLINKEGGSILQRAFLNSEYVLNCRTSVSSAGLFD